MRGELAHRIKNLISVIQAIAKQSLKGEDLAAARAAFLGRLKAVADAQLLLGDDHTTAAKLDDLVLSTLRPFVSEQQPTLISGPPVLLPPKQALTLTMAVHELATNSMKYGALSVPSGRVSITWDCVREGGGESSASHGGKAARRRWSRRRRPASGRAWLSRRLRRTSRQRRAEL